MEKLFYDLVDFLYPYFNKEWEFTFKGVPFNEKPDFSDFILSFEFLKIVDMASYFDSSPFSHESKHLIDLVNMCDEDILTNVEEYIESLIDRTQEVFKHLNFKQVITFLEDSHSLYEIISFLSEPWHVSSTDELKDFHENFIQCYFESDIYYKDYYDEFGIVINVNDKNFTDFLINLLFNDVDFKNKEKIDIYDPACADASILLRCKNFIKKINPNCKVTLFGCESNPRFFAIALSRILFEDDTNPYNILMYDIDSDDDFKNSMLSIGNFDFIISKISNVELLKPQKFYEYLDIYNIFHNLIQNSYVKCLFATSVRNISYLFDIFAGEIYFDYLDSIITLPISSETKNNAIFILDKNKVDERKNKFFLIDEYIESGMISNRKYNYILKKYRSFKEYENGLVMENSYLSDSKIFNFNDLFYDTKIGNIGDNIVKLINVSSIAVKGMKDCDLLLSKNFYKENKIAFHPHEVNPNDYENYFSLIISDENILKDYMYYYLNSNKGLNDINFLTRFNQDLFRNIDFMRIPIPEIKEQKNIVHASKNLENFFNQMELWKNDFLNNILNYRPALESYKEFSCDIPFSDDDEFSKSCKNWRIVYQGLAWPLAHSYLKATKGSTDPRLKSDNYLIFFEFLVAFNVVVLISAIKNNGTDEYDEIKNDLWQLYNGNKKTWHKMHFGGWTILFSRLSNYYHENSLSTPLKHDFFKKLSKKEYKNLFNSLRSKRNDDHHGGLMDDIDVNMNLDRLEEYMDNNIFEILNLYCGLKLYFTDSITEDISPKKEIRSVIPLNGPCNPYLKHKIEVHGKLKSYRLYFYDPLDNNYLEIDDDLMKFKKDEDSGQYNLYIFNGVENGNVEYKCYQYSNLKWLIPLNSSEDSYFNVSEEFKNNILRL